MGRTAAILDVAMLCAVGGAQLGVRNAKQENYGKVAGFSFSGSIPLKFEHKLPRHIQSFGKIATIVVLDKD